MTSLMRSFIAFVEVNDEYSFANPGSELLRQFDKLLDNPTKELKDYMTKYLEDYWDDGRPEESRPSRLRLYFENACYSGDNVDVYEVLFKYWKLVEQYEDVLCKNSENKLKSLDSFIQKWKNRVKDLEMELADAKESIRYYENAKSEVSKKRNAK